MAYALPGLAHYETQTQNMAQMQRWIQKAWGNRSCRTVIGAGFAMVLGLGAGRAFVGSVYVLEGASMEPAYPEGTHLYGAPISTPLERGDVVLLNDGKEDYAVKRIIGLPGETVHIWRGRVFINRQLLVEPYLAKHTYTFPVGRARRAEVIALGEGEYFVLGDNRFHSSDSRVYGPVRRPQIKQRVPPPDDFVGAYLAPYTLPEYGTTMVRPLGNPVMGAVAGR